MENQQLAPSTKSLNLIFPTHEHKKYGNFHIRNYSDNKIKIHFSTTFTIVNSFLSYMKYNNKYINIKWKVHFVPYRCNE